MDFENESGTVLYITWSGKASILYYLRSFLSCLVMLSHVYFGEEETIGKFSSYSYESEGVNGSCQSN